MPTNAGGYSTWPSEPRQHNWKPAHARLRGDPLAAGQEELTGSQSSRGWVSAR